MILTRVHINPLLRKTVRALENPNVLHGAIERTRPDRHKRILWRLDTLASGMYLLLLSEEPLDCQGLIDQFGYQNEKVQSKNYHPVLDHIREGNQYRFRLTANPTYSHPEDWHKRGKVKACRTPFYQAEWLDKKAERNGFVLDPDKLSILNSRWISFCKGDSSRPARPVQLLEVVYEGVLTVSDPERFKKALVDGIGRQKAYGMGLLTILPYAG